MRSRDKRFARVLGKLGYQGTQEQQPKQAPKQNEMDDLRLSAEKLGVRVDGRWGEDRLRQEIAAAKESSGRAAAPAAAEPVGAMTMARYGRRDMQAED